MFHGSMVAMATPMTQAGDVDFEGIDRLVDMHINQGTDAIVAVGTTGESATLTLKEQHGVIRRVMDQVAGRIPVIAGSSANSTQDTVSKTIAAMELGVDACLLMTPAYIKPTQEGLYQHYKIIAERAAIPQILYNVPGRTACDL